MAVSHVKSQGSSNWTGTVTVFGSNGASGTAAATNLVQPQDWNSVHNEFYTLAGNTVNASTVSGSNIAFAGSGNVYMSGSSNSIVMSTPIASYYENWPLVGGGDSQTQTLQNSISQIQPFEMPYAISCSYVRFPATMSAISTSFGTSGNSTFSASVNSTLDVRIFSQGVGASSNSLQLISSSTAGMSQVWSMQVGANSTQWTLSYQLSYPITGGTSSYSTTLASSVNSFQFNTGSLTLFTGQRGLDVPLAMSLPEGNYFLMFGVSSSTAGQANLASAMVTFSNIGVSMANVNQGLMGQPLNASRQVRFGLGSFSTAAGATTASLDASNISSSASNVFPVFQMYRIN